MTAFMPEDTALLAVAKRGYFSFTPHTLETADALIAEWAMIRRMHYAVENGELRVGMRGVAAPIFDCFSFPKYAIGVTGHVSTCYRRTLFGSTSPYCCGR
jgi:DNA-binding IclR family transcriptional regulator